MGRRAWLFVGSELAGQRAAIVMSLLQSAKLNGHNPHAYLQDVLERLPTHPASRIDEYPLAAHLTPREGEVLRLLARGLSNHEIAAELHIGATTAKWFVKSIMHKLGVNDRTAAVTTALERGLLH